MIQRQRLHHVGDINRAVLRHTAHPRESQYAHAIPRHCLCMGKVRI